MTDEQLRLLVRDAVARRLGDQSPPGAGSGSSCGEPPRSAISASSTPASRLDHPSHVLYVTLVNAGDACVIEPSVACDHCGYCKSHGH